MAGSTAATWPCNTRRLHQDQDRSKDIIISGGENISSIEVEDVLYRHPDVLAAAVVAKPDPKWGETPCAFIELKVGATTTPEDIVAHCKKHLAGFKVPRAVVFGELPRPAPARSRIRAAQTSWIGGRDRCVTIHGGSVWRFGRIRFVTAE